MKKALSTLAACLVLSAHAQQNRTFNQVDVNGTITQQDRSGNFNKHNNDTIQQHKEIPRGIYVWTVDRKFGDRTTAEPDTMSHLYPNTIFNTGKYGEYNTTGNNYTARLSRIFIDRPETEQFIFTQPYDWVYKAPDQFHFTNTLSPFTNISYDNCGDKTNGEDHIDAKFAVNAGKRLGFGFDLNYAYARGYYANQSASHFGSTIYGSYLGDRYNMHLLFSTYHQKVAENGGITDDYYVTHPESFSDSYSTGEIPTALSSNWNRNDNQHLFLTHRYNIGFYRKVKMTEEELKARQFAKESKQQNELLKGMENREDGPQGRKSTDKTINTPQGRPDNAVIAGDEPAADTDLQADTTRIKVDGQAAADSLLAAKARQDSIDATMKSEYVPVTSIIHTLELNNYKRIYQAYRGPSTYDYDNYYYWAGNRTSGDSIYDPTRHTQIKNTFALALLEGFNKWVKAGLKAFVTHEYRSFKMPDILVVDDVATRAERKYNEHNVSIGGKLSKTQGKAFHFNLQAEAWMVGEDNGQLKVDFGTDLNFPLFGDTVQLAAKAYFHRLNPTFYQRNYHSKHLWWDNDDLSKETRTRIEGVFSYPKTKTQLRVAVEEIQNYTYFGMGYNQYADVEGDFLYGKVMQESGNINVLTAQLKQHFKLGAINWENILTYQNSSNKEALPLPSLNIFTNLYLDFRIAKVLKTELGADCYFFTKYDAPDFLPQLNQYAIQQNADKRLSLGGYPFVDVYVNFHLKQARFFLMMSHATAGTGTRMYFLAPHYPQNESVLRFGVSWNFLN